ncbi:unnamed protein product [Cercospora beticola]|nr:unnamed protein product [Cercospora beticola]
MDSSLPIASSIHMSRERRASRPTSGFHYCCVAARLAGTISMMPDENDSRRHHQEVLHTGFMSGEGHRDRRQARMAREHRVLANRGPHPATMPKSATQAA